MVPSCRMPVLQARTVTLLQEHPEARICSCSTEHERAVHACHNAVLITCLGK